MRLFCLYLLTLLLVLRVGSRTPVQQQLKIAFYPNGMKRHIVAITGGVEKMEAYPRGGGPPLFLARHGRGIEAKSQNPRGSTGNQGASPGRNGEGKEAHSGPATIKTENT